MVRNVWRFYSKGESNIMSIDNKNNNNNRNRISITTSFNYIDNKIDYFAELLKKEFSLLIHFQRYHKLDWRIN
jgi:hypothetical protein